MINFKRFIGRLGIVLEFILFSIFSSCSQIPAERPHCENPDFDEKVSHTISFTIPTLSVQELKEQKEEVVLLDARQKKEFEVSHIEGARFIGFHDFEKEKLKGIPKDAKIVLYCSIGYRSEKVGEKLKRLGYTNVFNLYGSIFEWVNVGNEVVDKNGKTVKKIHTYNKDWSQWVDEKKVEKVW